MFSSSSPTPTANTWNTANFGGNNIGITYPSSVAYGNSIYVAVGVGGWANNGSNTFYLYPEYYTTKPVKYTTNFNLDWSNTTTNLDFINFTKVRFLNSKFLAVGRDSSGVAYVCESTDGNTWIKRTVYTGLLSGVDYPVDIAWNGTHYVVGRSATTSVYRSTDLITWTTSTLPSSNFIRTITYAAGLFVAPTNAYYAWTSPDGATWTQRTIDLTANGVNGWRDIIYANSKFVACGPSYFAVSSDGITWATYAKASTSSTFYSISYAYGKYIAVGGTISPANSAFIDTSSDGITWTQQTLSSPIPVANGITFDGTNILVISDYSGYITSTNATTWTVSQNTPGYLRSAAVGTNALFVGIGSTILVAGGDPLVAGQNATVLYSYDGLSWGKGTITGTTLNQNQQPVWSIVYSNGEFITNTGLRSTDGINWATTSSYINTAACLITTPVTNLLYASRGFFNATSDANIYKSTNNGVTWSVDYTNGSSNVGQMAYGAGKIIAISPSTNQVLVNPNLGVGWYSYGLSVDSSSNIVYANGQFYILKGTTYYRSVDGTSWSTGVITLSAGAFGSGAYRLFYKNGLYILNISGYGGINNARIFTSTNGINYTLRYTSPSPSDNFGNSGTYNITSNPNTFVTFTNNTSTVSKTIYYSTS
jgi:hypothetical protein